MSTETAAEKAVVQAYFNSTGFERWNRIYSDSSEVNRVQRNIRIGHQKPSTTCWPGSRSRATWQAAVFVMPAAAWAA
jgi:hypothetical protein